MNIASIAKASTKEIVEELQDRVGDGVDIYDLEMDQSWSTTHHGPCIIIVVTD